LYCHAVVLQYSSCSKLWPSSTDNLSIKLAAGTLHLCPTACVALPLPCPALPCPCHSYLCFVGLLAAVTGLTLLHLLMLLLWGRPLRRLQNALS
jgi:hypothetical protein